MQNQRTQKRMPLSFEAGLNYSLAAVLPVLLSVLVVSAFRAIFGEDYASSNAYLYAAYLIPQLCFAVAALLFFRRSKTPFRAVYRLAKPRYFVLAALLAFGLFSLSGLNSLFLELLGKLGYHASMDSRIPEVGGWYLLPALLIIALLPAVFEETIFRGIQLHALKEEGWGTAASVFLSGLLFALFHGNPEQTLYQFVCGVTYGLLAVRSESVLPTMLAHFLNNAVVLILLSAGLPDFPVAAKPYLYATAGAVLAGVLVWLIFFERKKNVRGTARNKLQFFGAAAVGIVVCLVEWVGMLVVGFSA